MRQDHRSIELWPGEQKSRQTPSDMLKTVAFWESFMSVLVSLTGTFYLRFASLFLQTSLPWVLRCCSVSLSTDAAKSAARADSAPLLLVRGIYTPTLNMTHNKHPVLESLTFFVSVPQFQLKRQSLACAPPHPGAVTVKEREVWVETRRFISPAKPGSLSGTSWTATSMQWMPPTEQNCGRLIDSTVFSCLLMFESWDAGPGEPDTWVNKPVVMWPTEQCFMHSHS